MSEAHEQMRAMNPNALSAREGEHLVFIEDWRDPDGRDYRIEYRTTPDGDRAVAYCLSNPWGPEDDPSAGEDYYEAHVADNGFICLGNDARRSLDRSPYDLEFAVRRARYWCTAFSAFKESDDEEFPEP